jgi:hypothetical protein
MCLCNFSWYMMFVFSFLCFWAWMNALLQVSSFSFGYGVSFKVLFVMCCVCDDNNSCKHQCGNARQITSMARLEHESKVHHVC